MDNPITPTPEASRSRLDALRASLAPVTPTTEPAKDTSLMHCIDASTRAIATSKMTTEEIAKLRRDMETMSARTEAIAAKLHMETRGSLTKLQQADEWKMISSTYGSVLVAADNIARCVTMLIVLLVGLPVCGACLIYWITHGGAA
jgi:hypothetical protein